MNKNVALIPADYADWLADLGSGQQPADQLAWLRPITPPVKAPPDDKPTIGLLLCKTKTRIIVEYARSGIDKLIDNGESKAASGKCDLQVGGKEKGEQA